MEFTHLDKDGNARMVDVSPKPLMKRVARAEAVIHLADSTIAAIRDESIPKGDVLTVAKIAGINAAKRNSEIIPLCHAIVLDLVDVVFDLRKDHILISTVAACIGRTGVELEALAAASGAALGVYDMCKAVDKKMHISSVRLTGKTKEPLS